MYAENFPHRMRGMVLDSVFDHGLSQAKFMTTQAEAGEDAFAEFTKVRFSSQGEWLSLWRKQKATAPVLRTHFAWAVVSLCSA